MAKRKTKKKPVPPPAFSEESAILALKDLSLQMQGFIELVQGMTKRLEEPLGRTDAQRPQLRPDQTPPASPRS